MSPPVPTPTPPDPDQARPGVPGAVRPIRVTQSLLLPAAQRLVSQSQADLTSAARRLIATAPAHDIDLSIIHVTVDSTSRQPAVRQACLPVLGAGRTAMMFVSEPARGGDAGGPSVARAERSACLDAACEFLARERRTEVAVAQGLPDPTEQWAIEAFLDARFVSVGRLAYMRRPLSDQVQLAPDTGPWPAGVSVDTAESLSPQELTDMLVTALNATYQDTLDCPELCGLRATSDILASHQSTGEFDPHLWWIVRLGQRPLGCLLLNPCPEQRTVELVYIGLAPPLRGKGLAKRLLVDGLAAVRAKFPGWTMACAVDLRNAPALKLYASLGFRAFGERLALVRALSAPA